MFEATTRWTGVRFAVACLAMITSGCGAGSVADVVRPNDPSYAAATGADKQKEAVCREPDAEGSPLVVDWKSEDRADLEAAMHEGVVIVHYDCDGVKVLPDCKLPGSYKYLGITRKEQVLSLSDADEAKANLPFSGGKIGAGLGRGSSIDVALVMVGKKTASSLEVDKSALSGRCEGATHFLRGATLGAFAVKKRTSGHASAAAEVFGAGASGQSSSEKGVDSIEGDIKECEQADADAPKPPRSCGAPLRVQLLAIGHKVDERKGVAEIACPKGTTVVNGKCAVPTSDAPHECKNDDIDDCLKQCEAGNVVSCNKTYLDALLKSLENNKYDRVVLRMQTKGCELGDNQMCKWVGDSYKSGTLGLPKDPKKAASIYGQICKAGNGDGCYELGRMAPPDRNTALLFARGCDAGNRDACMAVADQFDKGLGVPASPAMTKDAWKRACSLGEKKACARLR